MPLSEIEAIRTRLEILEAISAALERRAEVLDLIVTAASPEAAAEALVRLLGVTDIGARAILDTQLRRLTEVEVERVCRERDEYRARLLTQSVD